MRQAFLARALNALVRLTPALAERELSQAVAAPSDLEVLLRALESPEALAALLPDDPLVAARLRGLRARDALLQAEGGTMSAEQVSEILGISRQAVDKRRRAGRLIGLDTGRRGYAYPAWQLHGHGLLPGLGAVLTALASHDSWMQAAFFLESNPYLDDKSPLAQLRNGAIEAVIHAARASGEHGAA
jgi:biotin operon repressor